MNSTNWIIGIIVLAIIGYGTYYFTASDDGAMMQDESAMVKPADETMTKDEVMTGDTMMDTATDTMVKDESDTMVQESDGAR